jgi:hypothetical protein
MSPAKRCSRRRNRSSIGRPKRQRSTHSRRPCFAPPSPHCTHRRTDPCSGSPRQRRRHESFTTRPGWRRTRSPESRIALQHSVQYLGSVTFPCLHFTDDLYRMAGPVRLRDVAGELLVRHVGIVLERTGGIDHVDVSSLAAPCKRGGQLCAPDSRLEDCGEVDVVGRAASLVVGAVARHQLIDGSRNLDLLQVPRSDLH